ncbi:methionyl-tRNA transformylase [Magnaporthiopsis poae ATCC 64411]|uniref:Methionyl-tRNA transformylase n=1 Tax=Magnaporthiopsis poae (strain ATCC 64411 / 73-15) TaxID=644358 RepID=A0A0C4EE75_MAGP6|nr:methionyl-tRNA transformylase [Magnaporthiopsis poae ATCC 64411]
MSRDNKDDSRNKRHEQPPRILIAEVVNKATGAADRVGLLCVADADRKGALVILHELLVPAMKELLGPNSSSSSNGDDDSSSPPPLMAPGPYRNACVRIRTLHVAGQRPRPAWSVLSQCDFSKVHEPGRLEYE